MEESGRRVVLFSGLGVGHLTPMVELAKLFLRRGLAVTIAVPTTPDPASAGVATAPTVASFAAVNQSISFHLLPPPHYPDPDPSLFVRMLDMLRLCAPYIRDLLLSLMPVAALVVDVFCAHAVDVAAELRVPAYVLCTSSAGAFASFLHLPHYLSNKTAKSIGDMSKEPLHFPGLPPIPASNMPSTLRNRGARPYKARMELFARVAESSGLLLNTFEWLEARAVKALRDGACVPDRPTPPVYCVGPLVASGATVEAGLLERHACLAWLDAQPDRSVVFLFFGSVGAFPAPQLREIARGLEASGHRFLWVVRNPPDPSKFLEPWAEPDLEALLPDGFLERTRGRGLVVALWAPQAEVLRHASTGAFVTHCGWNSTLEGVVAGVPLLCWPQYAEQSLNKVFIVEEMKVGAVVEGYDEVVVKAEEVEAKMRMVMESDEGARLRARLAVAKENAAEAMMDGGPSRLAFDEFLKDLAAGSK